MKTIIMKTNQKTLISAFIIALCQLSVNAQDNRNYVSPSDTSLKIDLRYNNPMRTSYNVGGLVGVDVSTFSGGVYAEVQGAFSPKRFTIKGAYAFDISNSDFFSKSELYEKANPYKNLQFGAFFHLKDETKSVNIEPTIAVDKIEGSSTTSGNYESYKAYVYKTDHSISIRSTKALGFSFQSISSNLIYDKTKVDTTQTDFITFENQAPTPNEFILPYKSTILGLSFQMGTYSSYKVFFKYKDFNRFKYRASYFKTVNFELLFAPTIANNSSAIYSINPGVFSELAVSDVKKKRLGFRIVASTNQFKKMALKPGFFINGEVGMRPGIYPQKASKVDGDDGALDKFVLKIASQPFYMKVGIGFSF